MTMTTYVHDLSPDQEAALAAFEASTQREFALGGLAGTGKTTILRTVVDRRRARELETIVVAPTARACAVLKSKGVDAQTIHQAIYDFQGYAFTTDEHGRERAEMIFEAKEEDVGSHEAAQLSLKLDGVPDLAAKREPPLCVCDEASMVDLHVATDLRAAVPGRILWVGDHGQLPPVKADPGIMRNLDARLERIHRQAGGSAILQVAHAVRAGATLLDAAFAIERDPTADRAVAAARCYNAFGVAKAALDYRCDVAVVARNQTRAEVNTAWRQQLGRRVPLVVGDRLVGLKNNYRVGVLNGELYDVLEVPGAGGAEVSSDPYATSRVHLRATTGGPVLLVDLWHRALARGTEGLERELANLPGNVAVLTYGLALTCHKAQGGEWPRVLVYDEVRDGGNFDAPRWRYTAATRARDFLLVVG